MAQRPSKHRTVAVDVDEIPAPPRREMPWPWWAVAVVGTMAVLAAGWLLMAGAAALGWLTSPDVELETALFLGSNVLVLAHGVPVDLGGQAVSIMPLGLVLVLVVLAYPVAGFAARQAARANATSDDTGRIQTDGQAVVVRVAGTVALTHGLTIGVLAAALGAEDGFLRGVLGGVVLGGVTSLWGASRAVGFDPRDAWPLWLRSVPSALAWALGVCFAGGAAALVVALVLHKDRIAAIHAALDPGMSGTALLLLLQLLYLPNLVLWATSWVLGAGVTLGDDSLLSMSVTDVGFLPAIPVFGAVGDPGLGGGALFWWLAVGVAAGIVAALVAGLARPRARFDETALVGGLAGVTAGLLVALMCSLSSGGLGDGRLAHIGATTAQLIIVAPTLLGLSGLVAGAVLGLIRPPQRPVPPLATPAEEPLEAPEP